MTFTARYNGRCATCGEVIQVGDRLDWDDDQAIHEGCLADTQREDKQRPTCPKCWMAITASGACGCDLS